MATLVGLALSNLGFIPFDSPEYGIVNRYLLPLAIPLLLLSADLRKVIRDTGAHQQLLRLLPAGTFACGSRHLLGTPIELATSCCVLPGGMGGGTAALSLVGRDEQHEARACGWKAFTAE